jgi:hypothetical protein
VGEYHEFAVKIARSILDARTEDELDALGVKTTWHQSDTDLVELATKVLRGSGRDQPKKTPSREKSTSFEY